jgi:asparagine synthase (glutamine-hydrolysing)
MSDQPVATMCSGGLDSSLITALVAQEQTDAHAFNVAIADQPHADESSHARAVAAHLGVSLHTTPMRAADWRAGLVAAVRHCEYPLTHESSVPMAAMARGAREGGFKVLLSGEAADELFAGYPWLDRWRRAASRRGPGFGRLRRRAGADGPLGQPDPGPCGEADAFEAERRLDARLRYAHHRGLAGELEARLLADLSIYLPHLLNRQDKNTMQSSVETRVPFLDPDVLRLVLNLPLGARVRPAKGILFELGRRYLPRAAIERPKQGFGFALAEYLAPADPGFLADGMLRDALAIERPRWEASLEGLNGQWQLYLWTAEIWCRLFLAGASADAVARELWQDS